MVDRTLSMSFLEVPLTEYVLTGLNWNSNLALASVLRHHHLELQLQHLLLPLPLPHQLLEVKVIHISCLGRVNTLNIMDNVTWSLPRMKALPMALVSLFTFVPRLFETGVTSRMLPFASAKTLLKSKVTVLTPSTTTGSTRNTSRNKKPSVDSLSLPIYTRKRPSAPMKSTWAPCTPIKRLLFPPGRSLSRSTLRTGPKNLMAMLWDCWDLSRLVRPWRVMA